MEDVSPELLGLQEDPAPENVPQVVVVPASEPEAVVEAEVEPVVPVPDDHVTPDESCGDPDHYVQPVLLACGCTLPVQVTFEHPYTDADVATAFADLASWACCEACSEPNR